MNRSLVFAVLASALLDFATLPAAADPPASPAVIERGRNSFVRVGCSECHGTVGQGGVAGRRLVPDPLPAPALVAYVRSPTGAMPPYGASVLSDSDLLDIRAFLASIPRAASPADIAALRDLRAN